MVELPYSNRELDHRFTEVSGKLDLIIQQTTKTNGRVSSLERWQSYVLGFCAAVATLLIPIFFMLLSKYV